MSAHSVAKFLLVLAFLCCVASAFAQQPPANFQLTPYGPPVSVETAKKAAAAALAGVAAGGCVRSAGQSDVV